MESTKMQVFRILEKKQGAAVSGQAVAAELNLSRNAVWKAVNALRKDGYQIDGATNKGYVYVSGSSRLSEPGIRKALNNDFYRFKIYETLSSTNTLCKEAAENGEKEGLVIVASAQTEGKGRRGRSFFSPGGTGVYMSILLRPTLLGSDALHITTAAAVAVAEGIEAVSGKKAEIKWVNDIFVGGRKVSGILTEGSSDLETGRLSYAVLGIGVNVLPPEGGFPKELAGIADSLFEKDAGEFRNALIASILNSFYRYYSRLPERDYLRQYKERSMVIGKRVAVLQGAEREEGLVLGIDDHARLMVLIDGETRFFSSGEVSVRMAE